MITSAPASTQRRQRSPGTWPEPCIARIGLMGMDAHKHHIRLLSGFLDLSLDPGHIRFVGNALDPVLFIQLEFILSKQEGPLRRRIFISIFHRILHGCVDLCKSRQQACNLVIILLGHMINGLEAQRIQSRTAAHICALAACHTRFMEGRGDAIMATLAPSLFPDSTVWTHLPGSFPFRQRSYPVPVNARWWPERRHGCNHGSGCWLYCKG